MNISLEPINWEKPLIWFQVYNSGGYLAYQVELIGTQMVAEAEEVKYKEGEEGIPDHCIRVIYPKGKIKGAIRYVTEHGCLKAGSRYIYNLADETKVVYIEPTKEPLPEDIENLGEM